MAKFHRQDRSPGSILFDILNHIILLVFVVMCTYPFYYIFIYSVSIPAEAAKGGIYFFPKGFSLESYKQMFQLNNILNAAFISISRTLIGTALTVFCSAFFAYLLANPKMRFRKLINRITVTTMYLHAGLIPWYVMMLRLGLKNNFLLYIIPSAIIVFHVILIKTYIQQLPQSLEESAMIDGAGPVRIYMKIILPLCLPILATIAIFAAVGQWNTWQDNLYLASTPKLQTLQLLLLTYLSDQTANMMAIKSNSGVNMNVTVVELTPMSIRMTITMIVTLPIIFVYPFFQRYFVSGIMIGAVKG